MRYDLRLQGLTAEKKECTAYISIYAKGKEDFEVQLEAWNKHLVWLGENCKDVEGNVEIVHGEKLEARKVSEGCPGSNPDESIRHR